MHETLASLVITVDGKCECLHTELIDLASLGLLEVRRATEIEFDNLIQEWVVKDTGGRHLHSHESRDECLKWERRYMDALHDKKHGGIT
jgi:hypothetical protein